MPGGTRIRVGKASYFYGAVSRAGVSITVDPKWPWWCLGRCVKPGKSAERLWMSVVFTGLGVSPTQNDDECFICGKKTVYGQQQVGLFPSNPYNRGDYTAIVTLGGREYRFSGQVEV
jgi:hypothetical protein